LEGYSKSKIDLPKLIEDYGEAKIDSPQPKKNYVKGSSQQINTVVGSKYISPVPRGIFARRLYYFTTLTIKQRMV
jgi:hypothetical protein